MSDGTCPWVNNDAAKRGGKYCALAHAQDNGCTIPQGNNIPTTTVGSKKYLCYDFARVQSGLSRQSVHVRWPAHPIERG